VDYFEHRIPVADLPADGPGFAPGRRKVELKFSRVQQLPMPDGRPVSFHIGFLGFETAPAPPVAVHNFSAAMGDKMLAATGLDGDGWAAQRATMTITQPTAMRQFAVQGMVPKVPGVEQFQTTLAVRVDGKTLSEQRLTPGDFRVRLDVPPGTGLVPASKAVELTFSDVQRLPAPDGRLVGAKLTAVGFEPPAAPPSWIAKFPEDLKDPEVAVTGVSDDRWAGAMVTAKLFQPVDCDEFVVRGIVPQVAAGAAFTTEAVVVLDGREAARRAVVAGPFELHVPVPLPADDAAVPHQVEIRFSNVQTFPPPDGRAVGARLEAFGFPPPVTGW
jgi:hypothetical protein